MRDYTGKTVYLGMDVHKETYAVTAICDGQIVKRDTIKANPETLIAYCKKGRAQARGFSFERGLLHPGNLEILS